MKSAGRYSMFYHFFEYFTVTAVFIIIMIYLAISQNQVPGLNLINSAVFLVTGFMFIPSITQAVRTAALTDLRRSGVSEYYVCSKDYSNDKNGNSNTWAGIDNKNYRIAFYGTEQGIENGQEVLKTMKSTPRIIWMRPGTWFVIFLVIFFANFFFYDNVMWFFVPLSDEAFSFFQVFIYYLPCGLAFICPILSYIFVKVRDNILYECAVRLANEIDEEESDNAKSGKKIAICPNCGAKFSAFLKQCSNCGCSLEE